jgi:hypothetical protein
MSKGRDTFKTRRRRRTNKLSNATTAITFTHHPTPPPQTERERERNRRKPERINGRISQHRTTDQGTHKHTRVGACKQPKKKYSLPQTNTRGRASHPSQSIESTPRTLTARRTSRSLAIGAIGFPAARITTVPGFLLLAKMPDGVRALAHRAGGRRRGREG